MPSPIPEETENKSSSLVLQLENLARLSSMLSREKELPSFRRLALVEVPCLWQLLPQTTSWPHSKWV